MRNNWKKKSLYIASFIEDSLDDYGNKITIYTEPEFIGKENIQPLSGSTDIEEYGNKVSKMQKVLLDYDKYLGKFKENDLAYIEDTTPEGEEVFGDNANYRVDSVRNQNRKILIFFEKLPNK
ncbi:MAG: hypothetical protein HFJ30_00045 [Clostridia bacterium]|jgi:hypothetical protein|nr:hypothetical protein [Clostridia bacterium]MCI9412969.1 hypothetical protein [Clostridia bacterium]